MFKLIMCCNNLPEIQVKLNDNGTWRRIRVTDFIRKFVENPKDENELKIDKHLSDKLMKWREPFAGLLVEYYKQYKKFGLVVPKDVIAKTENYKNENDIIWEFVKEGGERDGIKWIELLNLFNTWKKTTYSDIYVNSKTLKSYLENTIFNKKMMTVRIDKTDQSFKGWKYFKLLPEDE